MLEKIISADAVCKKERKSVHEKEKEKVNKNQVTGLVNRTRMLTRQERRDILKTNYRVSQFYPEEQFDQVHPVEWRRCHRIEFQWIRRNTWKECSMKQVLVREERKSTFSQQEKRGQSSVKPKGKTARKRERKEQEIESSISVKCGNLISL